MDEEYKLVYETIDGNKAVSDWMVKREAEKMFNKLKANRKGESSKIVWCELVYSSLKEDDPDEEIVVDSFTRRVMTVMGQSFTVADC